jgi:hypothetical protein
MTIKPAFRAMPLPRACRAIGVLLAFGMCSAPAIADTCLDGVRQVAEAHGLSADPPEVAPGEAEGALEPGELAESGGVVEPPAVGDPIALDPPDDTEYPMSTAPAIESPNANGLSAGDRAFLESILVAARAEAEAGRERDCFERLREARAFVAKNGG